MNAVGLMAFAAVDALKGSDPVLTCTASPYSAF